MGEDEEGFFRLGLGLLDTDGSGGLDAAELDAASM